MSVEAATESGWDGAGISKDLLLEKLDFGVIKFSNNWGQCCVGKMGSAVVGRLVRRWGGVLFFRHGRCRVLKFVWNEMYARITLLAVILQCKLDD